MKNILFKKVIEEEEIEEIQFLYSKKEAIDKIWKKSKKDGKFSKQFNNIRYNANKEFSDRFEEIAKKYSDLPLNGKIKYDLIFSEKIIYYYEVD